MMDKPKSVEANQRWQFEDCEPVVVGKVNEQGTAHLFRSGSDDALPGFVAGMLSKDAWKFLGYTE